MIYALTRNNNSRISAALSCKILPVVLILIFIAGMLTWLILFLLKFYLPGVVLLLLRYLLVFFMFFGQDNSGN